jgi:hypothetical protein
MQVGNEIRPYPMAPGVDISIVRQGSSTAEEIFWLEHVNNRWLTWALRGAGWFVCFLGSSCLVGLLNALGEYIKKSKPNFLQLSVLCKISNYISLRKYQEFLS